MRKKGISKTLWIIVTAVVIFTVAIILLSIFTGGTRWISNIFAQWSGQGDPCKLGCNSWRAVNCIGIDAESAKSVRGVTCSIFPGCEKSDKTCSCTEYC